MENAEQTTSATTTTAAAASSWATPAADDIMTNSTTNIDAAATNDDFHHGAAASEDDDDEDSDSDDDDEDDGEEEDPSGTNGQLEEEEDEGEGDGAQENGTAEEDPEAPSTEEQPPVSALCRICMCNPQDDESGPQLESLFRTTVDSRTLYSMLVTVCVPLSQGNNDGMPDKICTNCKDKLVQAFKLYETCVKSDERIRRILQTQSYGGVQIKQEIVDDEDVDFGMVSAELYCDAQVKREESYDQDYMFDGDFYGAGLVAATYNTPNLRIQSVHNGPDVLVQLQDQCESPQPPPAVFEFEKYVRVTPKGHMCILCGRDFKYFSYFKQHALAQHDPEKPHKCQQCKYTFRTEQRLFAHMRNHMEASTASQQLNPLLMELGEMPEPEIDMDTSGGDYDQSDDHIGEDENVSVSINPDTGEKIYTCLICQKQLTTLPLYRRHQTVHTVHGRPYECNICHYRFAMKFSYNAHMMRHRQGHVPPVTSFKCPECDDEFPRRKLLKLHLSTTHAKSPSSFLNKTAPAAILASNISDGRAGHACPICSEAFNRESVLNNHMKLHELEAAQLKHSEICYVCSVCGVECETRDVFATHIQTQHPDVKFPNEQSVAAAADHDSDDEQQQNQASTSQNGGGSALDDPLSTSTPGKAEPKAHIKCELCSKTFPYACNLKQHKIIHHSELKPHECTICHYRFEYEGTLLRHMQKHSKPEGSTAETAIVAPAGSSIVYKCKLCSARFQKQKSMTWHLKTHRSIVAAGEGTQPSDKEQSPPKTSLVMLPSSADSADESMSPNSFAAKLDLKPHAAMQQMQQLQQKAAAAAGGGASGTTGWYKCGYCPQKLDSEEAYFQHLKGHRVRPAAAVASADPLGMDDESASPPPKKKRAWVRSGEHHKCNLCQKVFTFRSQLQQHTSMHHQPGKPYECGKCHYSFVHKLNLKRHELTHLEEERLASEEDPSVQLLEDESFNADADDLVEPVLDEMVPGAVGLVPVNRGGESSEASETAGGGAPKRNKCVVCAALFQREDQLIEHLKTHIERIKVTKQETASAKRIIADDNDRKCKLCAKVFKFSCQLKQHMQMHHSKDKPFECNICRYRFEFKGHMIRHKAINHAEEVAAEEASTDELPAKITTPTVKSDGSEVYQCPVCPMNFVKQRSLTWHLKTHSNSKKPKGGDGHPSTSSSSTMAGDPLSQCRICSRTFRDLYELKAHMLTHAGAGHSSQTTSDADHSLFSSGLELMLQDFPDTMETTDPLFDSSNLELVLEDGFANELDFQMPRYHETPPLAAAKRANESSVYDVAEPGASSTTTQPAKGKIMCELCKKDFLYSCNLKQHMQLHHAKEKPFECKICFYRFEYSGHLVRHIRQNHGDQAEDAMGGEPLERNFVCTLCSDLFESKSLLNSHLQTVHKGEKQFKCEFCPASFAYKKTYDNHREEHHSNRLGESSSAMGMSIAPSISASQGSFPCNFCKKTFSSAQKVDNHVCFQ